MPASSDDELDLLTPSKRRKLADGRTRASTGRTPDVTSPGTTTSRRSARAMRKPKAFDESTSDEEGERDEDGASAYVEEEEQVKAGSSTGRSGRRSNGKSKSTPSEDENDEDEDKDTTTRRRSRRKTVAPKMRSPVQLTRAPPSSASPTPTARGKPARLPRKRYSSPEPEPEVPRTKDTLLKGKAKASTTASVRKSKVAVDKDEGAFNTPSKAMQAALSTNGDAGQPSFIKPTSADAYFAMHASKTAARKAKDQTSSNLITSSWPSLSSTAISRFSKALADGSIPGQGSDSALRPSSFRPLWDKWLALASSNHSILFHGVGSMRAPLEAFLQSVAQRGIAGAVVLKGEIGGRVEEAMAACERYAGIQTTLEAGAGRKAGGAAQARARRIAEAFGAAPDSTIKTHSRRLFLLIYDLAAPHLLSTRAQTLLGILSRAPNLHLLGTVSHVSADSLVGIAGSASPRWVWQDLTTFQTPLDEMLVTRHGGGGLARLAGLPKPLSLSSGVVTASSVVAAAMDDGSDEVGAAAQPRAGGDEASGGPAGPVLKSVTFRSRRVFLLVAQYQLEMLSERQGSASPETLAMPYAKLKEQAARTAFINDMDMRSLLGEHLEHGFIRVAMRSASSGELEVWNGFAAGAEASQAQGQSQAVPGNQSHSYRAIPEHASLYLALSADEIRSAVALCKRLPQH